KRGKIFYSELKTIDEKLVFAYQLFEKHLPEWNYNGIINIVS
ncbi:4098_t:CDS:1, partial [Racocetra persica]